MCSGKVMRLQSVFKHVVITITCRHLPFSFKRHLRKLHLRQMLQLMAIRNLRKYRVLNPRESCELDR